MNSPLVLRSSRSYYIMFGVIFGPIFLVWVVLTFVSPTASQGAFASGIGLALIFGYLVSVRLVLGDDRITYRNGLRSREIAIADVKSYRIETGFAFSYRPIRRLVLELRGRAVHMDLGTFDPHSVKELTDLLHARGIERR